MILNNYTNLPENKETAASFLTRTVPICFVRDFPFRLAPGEHLLVPYYVDTAEEDSKSEIKYNATFTTIAEIDGDTLDVADVPVIKKTTFAGEHIIDLGAFELPEGKQWETHTFSLRTIQSNGISSITDYFRIIVEDTTTYETLDLNETDTFDSEYTEDDEYQCITKVYESRVNITGSAETGAYELKPIASYHVEVNKDQHDNVTSVLVRVNGNMVQTRYKLNFKNAQYNVSEVSVSSTNLNATTIKDIVNTSISKDYIISNEFTDTHGVQRNLQDYLATQPADLDANAIQKAIENKIGLTRLFEAIKAYKVNGKNVNIGVLPTMDIVVDYGPRVKSGDKSYSSEDIDVPSELTLDMNGTTIRALQRSDISHGHLLTLKGKFNTKIKNGKFVGNYENFKSFTANHSHENLAVICMLYCMLCSFENLDISNSVGYDCNYDSGYSIAWSNSNVNNSPPFETKGFIDYDGNLIKASTYPELFPENGVTCYYTRNTMSLTESKNTTGCISIGSWLNYNTIAFTTSQNPSDNDQFGAFQVNKPVFVHFYGKGNNNQPVFLKTVKIGCVHPCIIPKGAMWYRFSCVGETTTNTRDGVDALNQMNGTTTKCRLRRTLDNNSWGIEFINCIYHDTRTCVWDVVGVQCLLKGCKFYNVASERNDLGTTYKSYSIVSGGYAVTRMLVDIEDNSVRNFNLFIVDCEYLYGKVTGFTTHYCYNLYMRNCRNFGFTFYHNSYGITFKDSTFQRYRRYKAMLVLSPHITFDNVEMRGYIQCDPYKLTALQYPVYFQYSSVPKLGNISTTNGTIEAHNLIPFKSKIYNDIY